MAIARSAVTRVTQASLGRRAASNMIKDIGGAVNPLVNARNTVKQNMAFYQAPGVGTIDVNPTFTKGTQDGVVVPIVLGFVGLVCTPLAISGVLDMLGGKNKRATA